MSTSTKNTKSKFGVSTKKTVRKKVEEKLDITSEERDQRIKELKESLAKSLVEDRLAKEKYGHLWTIPKEKMTAKERKQAIEELKASVKRGIGRRSIENLLRILENDRNR